MDIEELRERSNRKVLLRGKSGRGKTRQSSLVALEVLDEGGEVLFIDTESEGATTILGLIDEMDYSEDLVDNLEYERVESYEDMKSSLNNASDFDVVVFDTLDHKHSYVLKAVTDAKTKAEADWNEYPQIYSKEKEFMDDLRKMNTNLVATIDPESGKSNKPKGTQVNIQGYFTIVVDLYRDGSDWSHKVENWIGRSELIGKQIGNTDLHSALASEIVKTI